MPNKVYINPETTISWRDSSADEGIPLGSLASDAGANGALHDFGTGARADRYRWRGWFRPTSPGTGNYGEVVEVYWRTSDGVNADNDDSTGSSALTSEEKLRNLTPLGVIIADSTGVATFTGGNTFVHTERYGGPVFMNRTSVSLEAYNVDNLGFDLTPVPFEVQ